MFTIYLDIYCTMSHKSLYGFFNGYKEAHYPDIFVKIRQCNYARSTILLKFSIFSLESVIFIPEFNLVTFLRILFVLLSIITYIMQNCL